MHRTKAVLRSVRNPRRRLTSSGIGIAWLTVGIVACSDQARLTERFPGSPSFRASVADAESAWNHVSFEVTAGRSGGVDGGAPVARRSHIRIDRQLDSAGWSTSVSFLDRGQITPGVIATVQFDARGAMIAAIDGAGRNVALPAHVTQTRTTAAR